MIQLEKQKKEKLTRKVKGYKRGKRGKRETEGENSTSIRGQTKHSREVVHRFSSRKTIPMVLKF